MLHYTNRQSRIHILSLDPVLATEVYERLHNYPGMESVELIRPGNGMSAIKVQDIKQLARETTTSKVLIFDVRRQTKARLQRPYSDIVRFNRPDFNRYCYSVLLGDGPVSLFTPDIRPHSVNFYPADLVLIHQDRFDLFGVQGRFTQKRQDGILLDPFGSMNTTDPYSFSQ